MRKLPGMRIVDRTEQIEGWTIPRVAEWCGVIPRTVTRWIATRKLTGWRWQERINGNPQRVIRPEIVMAFYVRNALGEAPERPPLPKIECVMCGALFVPRNVQSRYCGVGCKNESKRQCARQRAKGIAS